MIIAYKGKHPVIGENVFIAPTAVIIGDVVIEEGASVWFNAVVRGDRDRITIGARTNIQDGCVLHLDPGHPLTIGSDVTVGHGAVLHGCTIENKVLIGISAVILNDAVVGSSSIVGAGAVVPEGMRIGPSQLAAGVPAKIKKEYGQDKIDINLHEVGVYLQLSKDYQTDQLGP
jgi:carbonic anhydrase/acetyltransferase-like protein (isoleucine patch superfamily)